MSLFMLLAVLIHLRPKVHNAANISVSALFFVTCIHLSTINLAVWSFLGTA